MDNLSMENYEGVCRFCGDIMPVLAMDQQAADECISIGC